MIEQDKVADLMACGANEFMQKPFSVEALVDKACHMLDMESVNS